MPAFIRANDLDQRIWQEELAEFVPRQVFDVHTHVYRWEFNTDPVKDHGPFYQLMGQDFPEASWAVLDECDRILLPGRAVHRLAFPFPFAPGCDFEAANRFVAQQVQSDPFSGALMLVHPAMTADYLQEQLLVHRFLGLKPYRLYSATGDTVQCRITDFLPQHQIAVAHQRSLIIMLHLAKRDGIADWQNIDDLLRLSDDYPNVRWILAHCARSYAAWAVERVGKYLRGLPNVWYDTSSVCESDAIAALCAAVGSDRVMYGSDDVPIGVARGKYITFGYAWSFLSERNHQLNLSHCDPRMTFTRYEQLRAMRRAAKQLGMDQGQVADLFCNTAQRLIQAVQAQAVSA